jgi:hypothetical protein
MSMTRCTMAHRTRRPSNRAVMWHLAGCLSWQKTTGGKGGKGGNPLRSAAERKRRAVN